MVKYFVRKNLTDVPPTRDLDRIFVDLIDHCEHSRDELTLEHVSDFLTKSNSFATEAEFTRRLAGDVYDDNHNVTIVRGPTNCPAQDPESSAAN